MMQKLRELKYTLVGRQQQSRYLVEVLNRDDVSTAIDTEEASSQNLPAFQPPEPSWFLLAF